MSKISLLVAGAFFMEFLDATILAPALPLMAQSMGVEATALGVGVSIYTLTIAVFILPSGWLLERFGARAVFTCAIVVFTLGSIACGFSNSPLTFAAARALQGLGGAMMVPVGRVIVLRTTDKSDLMRAIALITWPGLTAPLVAAPLGGYLAGAYSWRAIFFVNVPLGVLGALLALAWTPSIPPAPSKPFDAVGFGLAGGALALALVALDQVAGPGGEGKAALLFLLAAGLAGLFALHMRRAAQPIVSLRPLAYVSFRAALTWGLIARVAISAVPFALPLMFEIGMGYSAVAAGLTLTPLFVGDIGIKPLTTPILRRFGFRRVLVGNALVQALTLLAVASLSLDTPKPLLFALLGVSGASRSLHFTSLGTLPFADVPPEEMNMASLLFSVSFQASIAFGIGFGAAAIAIGSGLFPVPALAAFRFAFVAFAALMIIAAAGHARLPADAGAAVTRPRAEA